jgi:hypothetical protein
VVDMILDAMIEYWQRPTIASALVVVRLLRLDAAQLLSVGELGAAATQETEARQWERRAYGD